MRNFLLLLVLNGSFCLFGQDSLRLQWTEVGSYPVDSTAVWSVDQLNNVYVSHAGSIAKYDSTGVLKFKQSVKSYGTTKQLVSINAMKLVHFSEEQQTLCFFDNTLTSTGDCIDLTDYGIYNAAWIAASARPEMIWVYDNVNSTLKLIELQHNGRSQVEMVNVKGLLGIDAIDQISEEMGHLFLLEQGGRIYELDFYGGLLHSYSAEKTVQFDLDGQLGRTIYTITETQFEFNGTGSGMIGVQSTIDLPRASIFQFEVVGNYVYFRTPKNVHKYTLLFKS